MVNLGQIEAEKSRTAGSVGRKKKEEERKKMEKSYAQNGKVTKSIFSEPNGISKRGQRLFVREEEIFAYTKFQNCKPIRRLVI